MTFTPGPWVIDEFGMIRSPKERIIVDSDLTSYDADEPWEANARLIAAAPDLLEAAQRLLAELGDSGYSPLAFDLLRAAIAKATGTDERVS